MPNCPKRVLLLISPLDLGAQIVINELLQSQNCQIVGIVRSRYRFLNGKFLQRYRKIAARLGLIYTFVLIFGIALLQWGFFITLLSTLLFRKKRYRSIKKYCHTHAIALYETDDINSAESQTQISSLHPDYLISVYFDQILKKDTIALAKIATLNLHPGILPRYRGAMAYFWKLLKREKYGGATLHIMNEKIDRGPILAIKKVRIKKHETVHSLFVKSSRAGAILITRFLTRPGNFFDKKKTKNLENHVQKLPSHKFRPSLARSGGRNGKNHQGKYYTLPTRQQLKQFYAMGLKFFAITIFKRYF